MLKGFWIGVFTLGSMLAVWAQPAGKPNIIYIYADDLGYGELGCYGQQHIKTPHLDALAAEGMRFTRHYAAAPVCAPSRAALMTGYHTGHAYIRGNYELGGFEDEKEGGQMPLPQGTFTLGHMLRQFGYVTGLFGKWGLGMHYSTGSPLKQGFDYYFGYLDQKQAHNHYPTHLWQNDKPVKLNNKYVYVHKAIDSAKAQKADFALFEGEEYAGDLITKRALHFMDSLQHKPFFMYVAYTTPHLSLQVPAQWLQPYVGRFPEKAYYGQYGYAAHPYPMSAYAAMITHLDAQVGLIMQQLKQLRLDSNTLVLFSSDNGATFHRSVDAAFFKSNGPLRGYKMDVYEGGIRVPLLARWPGSIKPLTVSHALTAQYDVPATLQELAGGAAVHADGQSFLNVLKGSTPTAPKEYVYVEYPENGGQVAVVMQQWKALKKGMKTNRQAAWELYYLPADPAEQNDVAAQHPEIISRINAIVQKEHQPAHIREWEFINPLH